MSDWQAIMIGLSGGIQMVSHFIMSDFRLIMVKAKETINTLCWMHKTPIEAQIGVCGWTCSYNPYKIPRICIELWTFNTTSYLPSIQKWSFKALIKDVEIPLNFNGFGSRLVQWLNCSSLSQCKIVKQVWACNLHFIPFFQNFKIQHFPIPFHLIHNFGGCYFSRH
jgi:hypothetical protein